MDGADPLLVLNNDGCKVGCLEPSMDLLLNLNGELVSPALVLTVIVLSSCGFMDLILKL